MILLLFPQSQRSHIRALQTQTFRTTTALSAHLNRGLPERSKYILAPSSSASALIALDGGNASVVRHGRLLTTIGLMSMATGAPNAPMATSIHGSQIYQWPCGVTMMANSSPMDVTLGISRSMRRHMRQRSKAALTTCRPSWPSQCRSRAPRRQPGGSARNPPW